MLSFRFQDPWCLLFLIPLALIGYAMVRRQKSTAVVYSDTTILATLPVTIAMQLKRFVPWVLYAGMILAVIALARPQRGLEKFRVRTEGVAMEMCIDRSGSMEADDFVLDGKRVDRLTAVKSVFKDFVEGRPDDLIGLIVFGGFADAKCPLTLDHKALVTLLDAVQIPKPILDSAGRPIAPDMYRVETATAIGDALIMAVDRLKESDAKSKVIVLLSDGASNTGVVEPPEAVEAAKAYGIKVYTIGIGDPNATRTIQTMLGPMSTAAAEMDEDTLRMIAHETGGKYFLATNTGALERVYAEIDQLEKSKHESRVYKEYAELYHYFLLPGLCLIALQVVLTSTRFRSLP